MYTLANSSDMLLAAVLLIVWMTIPGRLMIGAISIISQAILLVAIPILYFYYIKVEYNGDWVFYDKVIGLFGILLISFLMTLFFNITRKFLKLRHYFNTIISISIVLIVLLILQKKTIADTKIIYMILLIPFVYLLRDYLINLLVNIVKKIKKNR